MEDNEIVSLYFSRDERAIRETETKYGAYCRTLSRNLSLSDEDAEECVSDTLFAAWNRIPPEIPVCLRAFLAKITRNLSLKRLRDAGAEKRGGGEVPLVLEELSEVIPGGDEPADEVLRAELSGAVNRFLSSLPKRERDLLVLRCFYAYPIARIARAAGMTDSNVRSVLSRTRKKLREYLIKEKLL